MSTINVEVNGRQYVVGCEDGQEMHVDNLARQFDAQVKEIAEQVGAVGELRLFLLAALTTADELAELRGRLEKMQSGAGFRGAAGPDPTRLEQRAAAVIEQAARRIEDLAERVA